MRHALGRRHSGVDRAPLFLSVNRGKRSIQIDLKLEEGKDILWRLLKEADVFLQASRSGVMERLGFE